MNTPVTPSSLTVTQSSFYLLSFIVFSLKLSGNSEFAYCTTAPLYRNCSTASLMVLVLNGNSEIGAHVQSKDGDLL